MSHVTVALRRVVVQHDSVEVSHDSPPTVLCLIAERRPERSV